MKTRMLKSTFWGKALKRGEEIEVDDSTARRWVNNGIAELVPEPERAGHGADPAEVDENAQDNTGEDQSLDKMTVAELREQAKEAGIEDCNKMNKAALIEALTPGEG